MVISIKMWDEYVETVAKLVESREKYQRTLGKLASQVCTEFGTEKLSDLVNDLQETHGLKVSVSTLKNYRWVFDRLNGLNLPEDLSYRTLQYIASSKDPAAWAKRIIDEGLTSPEVFKLLREEKGLPDKKKFICKACGAPNEV